MHPTRRAPQFHRLSLFGRSAAIPRPLVAARLATALLATARLSLSIAPSALAEMPNGVAVGDIDQSSAVLWARSTAVGTLTFQVDDDPTFGSPSSFPVEVTNPLLPVKVLVEGLPPGALCHYRAIDADGDILVGSFPMPACSRPASRRSTSTTHCATRIGATFRTI